MKNIILVGFMGTGKTTIAKHISKITGMRYISTDDLIEKKEKLSIKDIFETKGESFFRKAEKDVIKKVSSEQSVIIDAGGGVVIDPENIKNLKSNGIIVCLWSDPKDILKRTKQHGHRPLLNVDDPLGKISELLNSRKQYYERSDLYINTSTLSIEEAVRSIIESFKKKENE